MKFRTFIIKLADRAGRQYLPLQDSAHEIDEFVGPDSVHDDLAPRLVRAIYKANRCGHLDAAIGSEPTFDALGQFHGDLLRNHGTDLDQIRFIQTLGDVASGLFAEETAHGDSQESATGHESSNAEAATEPGEEHLNELPPTTNTTSSRHGIDPATVSGTKESSIHLFQRR